MKTNKLLIAALGCFISMGIIAQNHVTWTNLSQTTTSAPSALIKTGPDGFTDGGAASTETIPNGEDGYFEYGFTSDGDPITLGVSTTDVDGSYFTVEYGMYISGTDVWVVQNGNATNQQNLIPFGSHQIFRIERVGTDLVMSIPTLATTVHTFNGITTASLLADVHIYSNGDTLDSCWVNADSADTSGCCTIDDEDWLELSGAKPSSISDNIYTEGQVGINTNSPEAMLHVKFPYACGQFHNGLYNALFDAREGTWANVVSRNGFFPNGTGGQGVGCNPGGWDGAYIVLADSLALGTGTVETARIHTNGNGLFNGVWIGSDRAYKSEIEEISNAVGIVERLDGKSYNFKFASFADPIPSMGFIAQDIQEVVPSLVRMTENGRMAVNYDGFIPILTEAIKEQQDDLEAKDEQIAALEEQLAEVRETLDQMQSDLQAICTDGCNRIMSADQAPDLGGTPLDGARLDQNNPNPTNEGTIINYYLPEKVENATLFVYDLNGRQLAKYALGQTGEASLNIQPGEFAAGTYLYSLIADGVVVGSKRMVIMD